MSSAIFDTFMKGFAIFCVVGVIILIGMGNSKGGKGGDRK